MDYFKGFRIFHEEGEQQAQDQPQPEAPGMLDTVKKQMRIPKKLWFGMPFTVGANKKIKLDGRVFTGPMTFYVVEFDNSTVTMKLVRNPMDFIDSDDLDDEIDMDNTNDGGEQKFTIPREVFEKLLEPDNLQGADFSMASQGAMSR